MVSVKRFILALVLALVANLVGATAASFKVSTLDPASAQAFTVAASDECHGQHDHSGTPADQHATPKCHTCCPAAGMPQARLNLPLIQPQRNAEAPLIIRPYADVVFSIDKPPKAQI